MGGVDFREQTRLPVLRTESCEDLKRLRDWRRLAGDKRMVGKQTKFKNQFPQKARRAGPSFCLTQTRCLIAFCAIGTLSPLAKAEEEEEGISDSRIVNTLSDAHIPNFVPTPYSSTRWTGEVLTSASC